LTQFEHTDWITHAPLPNSNIQTYPCSPPWLKNTDLSMLPSLTKKYRLIHAPLLDYKIQTYPCSPPWLKHTDLSMLQSLTQKYRLIHAPILDSKIQTYSCSPPWLKQTDLSMLKPFTSQRSIFSKKNCLVTFSWFNHVKKMGPGLI